MSTAIAQKPATADDSPLGGAARPPRVRAWWLRTVVSALACLFVLMAGGGIFNWLASFKQEPPRQDDSGIVKTYSVTVFHVEPVTLQRVVTAFGTAAADREVVVAAEVAGQVVEANQLKVGRAVAPGRVEQADDGTTAQSPGDLLVRIDPKTYEERVLQARKSLAQDDVELQRQAQEHANNQRLLETEHSNVKTAKTEYDNAVSLRRQGVGTESNIRKAELDLRRYEDAVIRLENELELHDVRMAAIRARRDAHQSDLELALQDLERTQVLPPFAGVISEVQVEQGQYVKPGDPLVRLTDPKRVEIPLSLTLSDYLDIASVTESGRPMHVALAENETAEPRWFSNPLDELRQAPEADERTRTVKVYTEVDNDAQDVPLLPGTFVHARLPGPVVTDAMVIPRDAVVEGTVFVAVPEPLTADADLSKDDAWFAHVERRPITIVRTLQSLVLVQEGLSPGDWVVTTNLDVIFDGARLKIDPGEGERRLSDILAELRTPQIRILESPNDR